MLFDVINPSDAYTIEADDFEVAAVATEELTRGGYGLEQIDGEKKLPVFLFGGDISGWWKQTFGREWQASFDAVTEPPLREKLIACLESVMIGSLSDRAVYKAALEAIDDPAKRKAFIERWHDEKRTSMNDFGACCRAWAKKLRDLDEKVLP